jgi:hypothetical protein
VQRTYVEDRGADIESPWKRLRERIRHRHDKFNRSERVGLPSKFLRLFKRRQFAGLEGGPCRRLNLEIVKVAIKLQNVQS